MKEFKYKINGNPYSVKVTNVDNNKIEMEVNGTSCVVELEERTKQLTGINRLQAPKAPAPTPTSITSTPIARPAATTERNTITSPLPGIITEIRCKVGDAVKKGDTLMILEAMKMDNNILANSDGKIIEIPVKTGESILEGAQLIVME